MAICCPARFQTREAHHLQTHLLLLAAASSRTSFACAFAVLVIQLLAELVMCTPGGKAPRPLASLVVIDVAGNECLGGRIPDGWGQPGRTFLITRGGHIHIPKPRLSI